LNAPLRQLIEMQLVAVEAGEHDRRVKHLSLTGSGQQLEDELTSIQTQHLAAAFGKAGIEAEAGWRQAMQAILDTA